MKKFLLSIAACLTCGAALQAQITITSADMPINGDTLRSSTSLNLTGLNLTNTGANVSWDYSTLTPVVQQVDTYKTAASAGYGSSTIPSTAYGYKVADTLTFPGAPASATNVYTFFNIKTSPSRYVAEGFGAKLNGAISIPAGYSDEDEWYLFPLTYNKRDSTHFKLNVSVPLLGTLKQEGDRKTTVDGWGTIKTPYYTTATSVLRVRSEVTETDSITFGGTNYAIPRNYVDYKWLANGQHYPALWITTNIVGVTETPSSVRYRDSRRSLGVGHTASQFEALIVYPNPASGAELNVRLPASWNAYTLHVFDAAGRQVMQVANAPKVPTGALPAGQYTIIAESNGAYSAAQFVK